MEASEIGQPEVHEHRLYTVEEVATLLRRHPDTVYRMGKRGILPPTKTGPKRGRTLWSGRVLLRHIHGED